MTTPSFDYIVVGAGSAGCVVASRLSEHAGTDVLLLEAGSRDDDRKIEIPIMFFEMFHSETDWEYYTEPQPEMCARELYWPRGKTLGGSSSTNGMIHTHGHPTDFDRWADQGNAGWSYEEVLPYFKRSEQFNGSGGDPEYHGSDGPLRVSDQRSPRDLSRTFIDAAVEAGYEATTDFNGLQQEGFGLFHLNQKGGRRHSAADAYLKPVLDRENLTVETGAHVTRLRLEGARAVGVQYDQKGEEFRVDAAEEVILCGGAVNSPQLLMLSGIGPPEHLREFDIHVTHGLRGVGRNLQDHLTAFVVYEVTQGETLDDADSRTKVPLNLAKFFLFGQGPFTSNTGEAGGFIRTEQDLPAPDLEIFAIPAHPRTHEFEKPAGVQGFTFVPIQLRPESRGSIRLRSADPSAAPRIDPQYLTVSTDLETLIEGVRRSRDIAQASAFEGHLGDELWPGEDVRSDDQIADYIRAKGNSEYHPVGTCKMGDGELAVVDEQLRVHGIEGLRVVDASIMPTIIGGHTNAPTVMIAEKAAEMITGRSPSVDGAC